MVLEMGELKKSPVFKTLWQTCKLVATWTHDKQNNFFSVELRSIFLPVGSFQLNFFHSSPSLLYFLSPPTQWHPLYLVLLLPHLLSLCFTMWCSSRPKLLPPGTTPPLKALLFKKFKTMTPHKLAIKQSTQTSLVKTHHSNKPQTSIPYNYIPYTIYDIIQLHW